MTTYSAKLDGDGIRSGHDIEREQQSLRRRVWDTGPQKPTPPQKPIAPHGKSGDPEYELAKIDFQETLEEYQTSIKEYGRLKQEYADWQKRYGGPYELVMWSMDVRDALRNDPKRYFESHPSLPNHGLPETMAPGPAHAENIARARAGLDELDRQRERDPQFGRQGVAA